MNRQRVLSEQGYGWRMKLRQRAVKRTACECRLNNIVLNNPVGFWSITGAGMGVGLWVIGTEKGEGGYCGTKHRPSCLLCLANAQQIQCNRL